MSQYPDRQKMIDEIAQTAAMHEGDIDLLKEIPDNLSSSADEEIQKLYEFWGLLTQPNCSRR